MLPVTTTWQNWAGTERSHPSLELAPERAEGIVDAIRLARETGTVVKPIGASHSFTAIGATEGIRISLAGLRGLQSADLARSRVTLWAGTHLHELPGILTPLGLALENMGDIDRQTIAGATSTGTHGTGLAFGGLATRITGVTLVDGTGTLRTIDEDHDPELLPAVALGLGALGVLVTVTIQCVPRFLINAVEAPAPLDEVLDEWQERSEAADHFEFFWFPHTRGTRTKTNTRLPLESGRRPLGTASRFLDEEVVNNVLLGAVVGVQSLAPRITPAMNRLIENVSSRRSFTDESYRVFVTRRRVKFREMEYSVPFEAVPDVVRELRTMIERRDHRVSFPVEVRAAAADQLLLSTASGRRSGYVAVHRFIGDRDTDYFRDAEAILAAHDGRPHWGKMHTLDAEQLAARYPGFEKFREVRDRLDPHRVFRNAYLERVLGE
ncbi:FAD-binding protein [Leucobacter sp. CSA2]|uniref:FAD-binding protein n=1 Tax=Leucobacter edaphi TaxID=2796472 RepID=A0A934QCT5_9MICO|nr:FAD-binding protein [Leucobacter edaphi]